MAKIFKYRGKTFEELKSMSVQELAGLFPASARRKIKKGFTEQEKKLLKRIEAGKKNIKTHCRDMIILPNMVGKTILIHKGNKFAPVTFTEEMIGHRFGEFILTRTKLQHSAPGIGATKSTGHVSVK